MGVGVCVKGYVCANMVSSQLPSVSLVSGLIKLNKPAGRTMQCKQVAQHQHLRPQIIAAVKISAFSHRNLLAQ